MEKPIVKTEIQETRDLAERELQMSQERKCNRRRFLGIAAMSIVGAELGMIGSANAQSTEAKPAEVFNRKPGTNTSFASLKQIDAGVLNVGYAEAGPAMVLRSFFCTAGRTTFTALSMLRRCWRQRVIE